MLLITDSPAIDAPQSLSGLPIESAQFVLGVCGWAAML
jgi:hypothetical protein